MSGDGAGREKLHWHFARLRTAGGGSFEQSVPFAGCSVARATKSVPEDSRLMVQRGGCSAQRKACISVLGYYDLGPRPYHGCRRALSRSTSHIAAPALAVHEHGRIAPKCMAALGWRAACACSRICALCNRGRTSARLANGWPLHLCSARAKLAGRRTHQSSHCAPTCRWCAPCQLRRVLRGRHRRRTCVSMVQVQRVSDLFYCRPS